MASRNRACLLLSILGIALCGSLQAGSPADDDRPRRHGYTRPTVYAPVRPADVEFTAEQLGGDPLPYQPVLVRLTLTNRSAGLVGPARHINTFLATKVESPERLGPETPSYGQDLGRDFSGGIVCGVTAEPPPLVLRKDERTSISFAVAGQWPSWNCGGLARNSVVPLFTVPGTYRLAFDYPIGDAPDKALGATLVVTVRDGTPQDRAMLAELRKDPAQTAVVMSPVHSPTPEMVAPLEKLLARYPTSGYADYVRYALARGYLKGSGTALERDGSALLNWYHEWFDEPRMFAQQNSPSYLLWSEGERGPAVPTDGLAERLATFHDLPAADREATLEALVELRIVSADARRAASALLDDIRSPRFPYRANVLLSQRRIASANGDPAAAARAKAALSRDHADNRRYVEWLWERSEPDAWLASRVTPAAPVAQEKR